MKKIYLILSIVLAGAFSGQAQIANFNMENWTNLFGGINPTGWVSNNVLTSNSTVVQDGSIKHGGAYSAKIVTGVLSPNPLSAYMPDTSGFMLTGALNIITQKIQQGYQYTNRSDTLGVWAKYDGLPNDTGFIYVALSKWNALGTNSRDTIASGTYFFYGTDAAFSFRNITLDYASFGLPPTTIPDTAMIIVSSSKRDGGIPGSKIWVDDFVWDPAVGTGIKEKVFTPFSLFPAPAQNTLNFNFGLFSGKKSLKVFDVTGKSVLETTIRETTGTLDVSALPEGFYQVMIADEDGLFGSEKLLISGK